MLRALVVALLLANLALLAWQRGLLDGLVGIAPGAEREPGRLQRQLNPERLSLQARPAASAATAAAPGAAAAQSPAPATAASAGPGADAAAASTPAAAGPGASAPASAATVAAKAAASTTACLLAGPFIGAEAEAAERTLRDASLPPGSWAALASPRKGSFVIYMGRYADRDALARKIDELKRLKINAEELRHAPELSPGLSVGRFDSAAAAEAELARLAQRGLRTAKVITITPDATQVTLRAPAADAALRARLVALRMPSGPGFVSCPADAATP